ncbi:serine/threonine dehydratase [Actinoplanes sp. NPDC051851]|uniref:serine/threonine dehydratase n=1 Tax=Actinoplanes sp. NPDC051851 TaxID=3154753 RepID=UPI003417B2BD
MIGRTDVEEAARRIEGRIRRTPLVEAAPGLWFKLEYLQHAGSFKTRGMMNRILAAQERGELPAAGIVVASGGNAGLAAAYAARELGIPVEVFVPVTAPPVKVAKLGKLGARVVQVGNEYAEAYEAARSVENALFCHAYDDPDMVAGNGTIGLEISGESDRVLVAVGGGGLLAGVIAALKGRAEIVAVEPENSRAFHEALKNEGPTDVTVGGVAADSLGARRAGDIAFELATGAGIATTLVTDEEIVEARRRLWDEYRIVVEHGTAAAYAAYRPEGNRQTVVLLCGANTNPADLG